MLTLPAHSRVVPARLTSRHFLVLAVLSVAVVGLAGAGVTGDEFKDLYQDAKAWSTGYLGRGIAMLAFILGAGWSAARQNMMPVIFGLILAMIISIGPDLVDDILTATV